MFILVKVVRFHNPDEASEYADENILDWNKIIQYEDDDDEPYVVECYRHLTHGATIH